MSKARDLASLAAVAPTLEVADISDLTATATELNYVDGVTSAVQTQLNAKVNTSDIGSSVLAYDANLQSFTDAFTLPTSDGTTGQVLTTNGSGTLQLSDLPASGSSVELVASGTLSDGSTVVVNSDGTVSVVSATYGPSTLGSATQFESSLTEPWDAVYDEAAGSVVIAYQDHGNSSYGTAVVGTISGFTITFGTPVVFSTSDSSYISLAYDKVAQKVIVAYRYPLASNRGEAKVGTISGNSITFGSSTVFYGSASNYMSASYDEAAGKIIIAFTTGVGRAVVGTVSGTSISFSSSYTFCPSNAPYIDSVYDPNNQKVIITYKDESDNYGKAIAATTSGDTITFGTAVTYETSNSSHRYICYDTANQKILVTYKNLVDNYGYAVVGSVSGSTITFGTSSAFTSSAISFPFSVYDAYAGRVIVNYMDEGDNFYAKAIVGQISGNSISFGSPVLVYDGYAYRTAVTYDPVSEKSLLIYSEGSGGYPGTSKVFQSLTISSNLTSENFIGFSDGSYSDTQTATVKLVGAVATGQSGLTPGQKYYVQLDGTLGLNPATTSVYAGVAVASDKIIVKG